MEYFWPKMDKLGIKTVIQTGDYFDNRKWLNVQSIAFQDRVFVQEASDRGITVHGIIGNHDIPYRNSLSNSSVVQLLEASRPYSLSRYSLEVGV